MTFPVWFSYTQKQRTGLVLLAAVMVAMQLIYWFGPFAPEAQTVSAREKAWLALQSEVDSLKNVKAVKPTYTIYPFNPNFITDYKGYRLGMSVSEIDRLLAFRKSGKFVNSAAEFQAVTGVSDAVLGRLSPYFKFPDWVLKKQKKLARLSWETPFKKPERKDINAASADDLIALYGIGPALAERILKFRDKLGGFVSMEQMVDVWGLSDEVVTELETHFEVRGTPAVKRLKINEAGFREILGFPYFNYQLTKALLAYRSLHNRIASYDDLSKIAGFPNDRLQIISLYLEL